MVDMTNKVTIYLHYNLIYSIAGSNNVLGVTIDCTQYEETIFISHKFAFVTFPFHVYAWAR